MQIIFASDKEPISKIISTVTACKYHHVGAVFGDFVIEARFKGVVKTPLDEFKKRGEYEIFDYPLDNEDVALDFAKMQIGKEYDFAGLISFPLRVQWQDSSKWYCSESVAAITKAGGNPIAHESLTGVSPRDLLVILKYLSIGNK